MIPPPTYRRESQVTATAILETLAREFSIQPGHALRVLEMIDAGLSSPFIGRFRRGETGALSESTIRRLNNRRLELEELDRRRGTILRLLEKLDGIDEAACAAVQSCMDRFELEDLFVPHRRPEPEVQLAIDRGLAALADLLIEPVARPARSVASPEPLPAADDDDEAGADALDAPSAEAPEAPEAPAPSAPDAEAPRATPDAEARVEGAGEAAASGAIPASGEGADVAATAARANSSSAAETPSGESAQPPPPAADDQATGIPALPTVEDVAGIAGLPVKVQITPELARLCAPFVSPDRGIHTESEALAGAIRILSDRLARDSQLRSLVRRMFRKRGVLSVRPLVEEGKAGRHRPLFKLRQPLRQIQGHRLLAIRQAQKERVLNTVITLAPDVAVPKVRAAMGKHTLPALDGLLDEIARQTFVVRLAPVIEADVRLELKERGDAEALRFLSQHLRQILLTPANGPHPIAGVDVNPKGEWTVAALDSDGAVVRVTRIEPGEKEPAVLSEELREALAGLDIRALAIGHGKGPRAQAARLRACASSLDVSVAIVNESGLSTYASSDLARRELPDHAVPARMAISLGRRLQDPMAEVLKVDPRHLGLGYEQGLVSKANARRAFNETVESCVAHVGCDLNRAPLAVLRNVPGLDEATARNLVERREREAFASREQLRNEGLLTEAQWTSSIAFLRVRSSAEPLDGTSLHPENYDLARRLLESVAGSVEESLGRPGVTKGLRRANFDVDEATWRDLMRELSHPGRDPRPRAFRPAVLDPENDLARLTKDRVVEGYVTNVASFGAFVDVGLAQDAMIHISEISSRYVRDARELLSIGQAVRARILDASGPRLALSLKNVPYESRRPPRRDRRDADERHEQTESDEQAALRAAQSRRDGFGSSGARRGGRGARGPGRGRQGAAAGAGAGRPAGGGAAGGRPGGGRPGGGRSGGGRSGGRRDDERLGRDERVSLEQLNASSNKGYSPFATFFKNRKEGPPDDESAD